MFAGTEMRRPSHDRAAPLASASVKLQLASAPRVLASDGRELRLALRDAVLLAWLALEGPTPRARLAGLLWPDSEPESGRNALRQRLFQLRRQVGMDLVAGGVQLSLADGVTHDLADAATVLGGEQVEAWPEVEAWLSRVRSTSAERQRQRLQALVRAAERAQDWSRAVQGAQDLLALDPLREDAHRSLMRALYLSGDRAAALQAFERCAALLQHEIGTAPSTETLALLETLKRAEAPPAAAVAAVPAGVLLPPRLIGRDAELRLVQQAWAAGQVVAVIGEAGLGKTRLLQTLARMQPGVAGAAGRPGDAGVPFATLARLLRAVMLREGGNAGSGPSRESLTGDTRLEIARVLPELDAVPARPPGEGHRLVMQRALRSLLEAQPGLTGLWVDDLHFADEASMEMLHALIDDDLAPPPGGAALRWVLAYRPAEAGSPVDSLHDALVEHARLAPVVLQPLDEAALAALVDSLGLPGVSGTALAPGLLRRTGGNPLFVLETLKQAWVERTLAQLPDTAELPRPVSIGRLIERRLAQLSPAAIALARVAAIAGPEFSIAMAEDVLHASAIQFADALNELESAQVMRGNAFAHDLVLEAVRASVPSTIAAHTHARIAAWLAARGAEPARVAQHWLDGGQPQEALPWLQRAAEQAHTALRNKEQITFLERKSCIEEALGDRDAAFDTLLQAAQVQVETVRDPGLTAVQGQRLRELAGTPARSVRALLHQAASLIEANALQAADIARVALQQAMALDDGAELVARARLTLGHALTTAGGCETDAVEQFVSCADWIDAHGSLSDRADLHGTLGVLYDNLGRLDDAVPRHKAGHRLALEAGHIAEAAVGLSNLACNRLDAGDLPAARRALEDCLRLTAEYDDYRANLGFHYAMLVLVDCHDGRYAVALQRAQLAIDLVAQHAPGRLAAVQLRLAEVWSQLGQWARVQSLLDLPSVKESELPAVRAAEAMLRHRLRRGLGQPADGTLVQTLADLPMQGRPDLRLPLQLEYACTLAPTDALAALRAVAEDAARVQHQGTVLAAHIRASRIAADCDPPMAARHARRALDLAAQRQSTALMPAERWLQPARAFIASGDREQALALVTQGQAWLHATARDQMPDAFRESFLHRNPVNRDLLQLTVPSRLR
jgi:DNA-binding SARP family transcriptional activator